MSGPRRSPTGRLAAGMIAALLAAMTVRFSEAPATVAEQRARLPPAAECESEVAGTWKALVHDPVTGFWYDRILEVREVEGNPKALEGMMYVDAWRGGPELAEPGPCGEYRYRGKMVGHGSFEGGVLTFGGGPFELVELICGGPFRGYNPDNFSGRIEKERQEFQSLNNDGGAAVNSPNVFRRIACFDDEPRDNRDVASPPFFPQRRSRGCGAASD